AAPAVRLFAEAMRDPGIVKGVLCHGLWILTPVPELLANRRVTCHEVVLADVVNAGGIYTPSDTGIVIDDDLVTGRTGDHAGARVDASAGRVGAIRRQSRSPPATATGFRPSEGPQTGSGRAGGGRKRRILVLLSEWGYWGEELIGPLDVFDAAGYDIDF